jgi:hypothetical protein
MHHHQRHQRMKIAKQSADQICARVMWQGMVKRVTKRVNHETSPNFAPKPTIKIQNKQQPIS